MKTTTKLPSSKTHCRRAARTLGGSIAALVAVLTAPSVQAATYYWDTNGATAGSGAATGTWGTSTFWTTDSTGSSATSAYAGDNSSDVVFSAGTNGTTGTVTISGTQNASSITLKDNVALTLSGGTALNIGGTGTSSGIFVSSGDNAANGISTAITLNAASTIQNAGTGVLTISGGITGAQNLIINDNSSTANGITFSTTSINNTGTITNSGAGSGNVLISSAIGANVTGITQNSATSSLKLQSANTVMISGATPISIQQGTFNYTNTTSGAVVNNILGTGTITMTPTAGTTTLYLFTASVTGNGVDGFGNAINIADAAGTAQIQIGGGVQLNGAITGPNGSNTPTLLLQNTNGANYALNVTGGITGKLNVQLQGANASANNPVTVSTGTVNNAGTISATSTLGTSNMTLSAPIGTAVTGLSQAGVSPFIVSSALNVGGSYAMSPTFTSTGTGLWTLSGGISGTGNLVFNANSTGGITVSTTAVNQTGSITNSGTSSGAVIISASIGSNVTSVTQSSVPSALTLSGTNTFTGGVTLTNGLLYLNSATAPGAGTFTWTNGTLDNSSGSALTITTNPTISLTNNGTVFTGSNSLNLGTGNVTLLNSPTINVAANTLTLGGNIQSTGNSIAKAGAGTLVLGGTNAYTGGTTVSAGTLVFQNTNAQPASGTVSVSNGATLGLGVAASGSFYTSANIDSAFANTLANVSFGATSIVGIDTTQGNFTYASSIPATAMGLTKLGTNTLALTGANSYTGATNLLGGALQLQGAAALPSSSAVNVSSGTALQLRSNTGATFTSGLITLPNGTVNIDVNNISSGSGNTLVLGTASVASAGLNMAITVPSNATPILNVTGGNGYILSLGNIQAPSGSGGPYAFTVNPNSANVTISQFQAGSYGSTFTVGSTGGGTVTLNSFASGSNGSNGISVGSGTLILTGATTSYNNRTSGAFGATVGGSGTLVLNNSGALNNAGSVTAPTLTISGGTLDNTTASAITISANPTQTWSGSFFFTGTQSLNLGTGAVTLTASPTVTTGANTLTIGGNVSGAFSLTKAGAGALTISNTGAGTFNPTGGLIVSNGTVTITNNNAVGAIPVTVNYPGVLALTQGEIFGVLNGNGTIDTTGGINQFYTNSNTSGGFSGVFKGANGYVKQGTGTETLSGQNTYTASTLIQGGLIQLNSAENAGTSGPLGKPTTLANSIVLSGGGGLQFTANNTYDYTTGGRLQLTAGSAGVIDTNGQNVTFANAINVTGAGAALTKQGLGTLTLTAANTYTGTTTVQGGGTLNVGNGTTGSLASGNAVTFAGSGTLNFAEAASSSQSLGTVTTSAGEGILQSTYAGSGTTTLTVANLAAPSTGADVNIVPSGGTNGSTNIINLTQYNGSATTAGQVLGANVFFNGSSYAAMNGAGTYVRGLQSGDSGYVPAAAGTTVGTVTSASNVVLSGAISAQTAATMGTITLASNNMTDASGVAVQVNGILSSGSSTNTWTTSSTAGTITPNSSGGTLNIRVNGSTDQLTISNTAIANNTSASNLIKSGQGTLVLGTAPTYTGQTYVDAGTLKFNNVASAATTYNIASGGTLEMTTTSTTNLLTVAATFNGTGTLKLDGGGSGLIFGGSATDTVSLSAGGLIWVTGNTTVTGSSSGRGQWGSNLASLQVDSGSTLNMVEAGAASGASTAQFDALNGAGTISLGYGSGNVKTLSVGNANGSGTFGGVLKDSGSVSGYMTFLKAGVGTETLTGTNTYTGNTTVSGGGSLIIGSTGTLYSSAYIATPIVTVGVGSTLSLYAWQYALAGGLGQLDIGAARLVVNGGTITYTGVGEGSGAANSGRLFTVGTGGATLNASGSGTWFIEPNATYDGASGQVIPNNLMLTLTGPGKGQYDKFLSGSGSLTVAGTGSGAWILTGANIYTGTTTVSSGTLTLSGTGAVNSSSGITVIGSGATFLQTSSTAVSPTVTLTQGTLTGNGTVNTVNVGAGTGGIISNNNGVAGASLTIGALTFKGAATVNTFSSSTTAPIVTTTLASNAAGTVTINPTASIWTNGSTYNLISYGGGSIGGAGFGQFALGTVTGLANRLTPTLGNSGTAITISISGNSPVWSGAGDGTTWTTAPTNNNTGPNNWALLSGNTGTNYWANDAVQFNDTYNLGAGPVAVTNSSVSIAGGSVSPNSVTFNNSAVNYTINSGDGSGIAAGILTMNGNGTVTITTVNTYAGPTNVNAGTLQIGGSGSLGSGSYAGAISIGNGAAFEFSSSASQTLSGIISGGGSITKDTSGASTLTLTNANTYTGGLTINTNSGTVNATITQTSSGLGNGPVSIGSGSTLILNDTSTTSVANVPAINNVFTGSGLLKLQFAAGTTARNTYMPNVTGFSGTIELSNLGSTGDKWNAASIGTVPASLNIDSGSTILVMGTGSFTGGITITGAGNSEGRGAIRISGATTVLGGNINLAGSSTISMENTAAQLNGNISSGAAGTQTLTLGGTGSAGGILSGVIGGGTGTINLATAVGGTYILTNTSTYTGTTTIAASTTLQLGDGTSGHDGTIGGTSGVTDNGTLAYNGAGSNSASYVISGTGAVTMTGTGTQTLSGGNTYTGSTTVSAGTLTLSDNRTVTNGGITVGNTTGVTGTLNLTNGTFTVGGTGSAFLVGAGTGGIGVMNQSGGSLTTSTNQLLIGNGTGTGTYNLSGGTLTTIAGSLGVTVGVNTGSTATFNLSGTGILNMPATSTLQITRSDNSAATGVTGTFTETGGTATVGILQMGGSNTTPANNAGANATLTLTGGTFTATTFNTLSGANNSVSTINIGGTAVVTLPNFPTARGTGAAATINFDGGTLKNSATGTFITGLTNALIKAGGASFDTSLNSTTVSQNLLTDLVSTGGGVTKNGPNTLTLSGANTFTGGLNVAAGTVTLSNANAAGTGTINFNTGGAVNATVGISGNLTIANPILVTAGSTGTNTLLAAPANTSAFSGAITANDNLAISQGGPLTLTVFAGGASVASGKTITLTNSTTGTITAAGIVTGAGGVTTAGTGAGAINISGASTYTGGFTLGGSSLVTVQTSSTGADGNPTDGPFGAGMTASVLGTGTIQSTTGGDTTVKNVLALAGDVTVPTRASETSLIFTGPATLTGTRTFTANVGTTVAGKSLTFSGAIGDGGIGFGIAKAGTGLMILSGANTYGGVTSINGGILSISAGGNLGNASATNTISINGGTLQDTGAGVSLATNQTVTVGASGGTVNVASAADLTINGTISGTGNLLTKTGNGILNLNGSVSDGTTLKTSGGTTNVNAAIGTGTAIVDANATTNFTTSQTLSALNIGSVMLADDSTSPSLPGAVAVGAVATPEPGSIGLLLVGALGLAGRRRLRA